MIKSGSLVRFKNWKNDYLVGTDSNKRIIAIDKSDSLMFLEEIRIGSSEISVNVVKVLTGSGIIVTILADASEFEILEAVK
jgi:hypothetical protein